MSEPPPMNDDAVPLLRLPQFLQEVGRLTSVEHAVALARKFGGTKLYVPWSLGRAHPLTKTLGPEAASILVHYWAGDTIKVPRASAVLRRHDARRLRRRGWSVTAIAATLGVTPQLVERLVSGAPKGSRDVRDISTMPEPCPACLRPLPSVMEAENLPILTWRPPPLPHRVRTRLRRGTPRP